MKAYTYRVVTTNGHGIHGPDYKSFGKARSAAAAVAKAWSLPGTLFEVERVEHCGWEGKSHRYYLQRGRRWVAYPCPDADVRKPDFFVSSPEQEPT